MNVLLNENNNFTVNYKVFKYDYSISLSYTCFNFLSQLSIIQTFFVQCIYYCVLIDTNSTSTSIQGLSEMYQNLGLNTLKISLYVCMLTLTFHCWSKKSASEFLGCIVLFSKNSFVFSVMLPDHKPARLVYIHGSRLTSYSMDTLLTLPGLFNEPQLLLIFLKLKTASVTHTHIVWSLYCILARILWAFVYSQVDCLPVFPPC